MNISNCESVLTECQKRLLEYWVSISREGRVPTRRDLNPVQLGVALAHTSLAQREDDYFRFRLAGSRIEALFGRNVDGNVIEKIDANIPEAGTASMELALDTGRPVSGSRKIGARWHCWLRVPLLDDDGFQTLVLCLDEFPSQQPRLQQDQKTIDDVGVRVVA